MKKLTIILAVALITLAVFTGCSEKKQLTAADVEGTWINVEVGSVVTNTFIYKFKLDMTYTVNFSADTEVVSLGSDKEGVYSLSGSTITITENSESRSFEVEFRDGDMIWITPAGVERVFKRQ